MTFFNKKTEVMQIEMTPYGRYLYSIGKFMPHSYEFVDDDVIYRVSGSGEAQEAAHSRILEETPKLKINRAFQDEAPQVESPPIIDFPRVMVRKNNMRQSDLYPMGRSSYSSDSMPQLQATMLQGSISGSQMTREVVELSDHGTISTGGEVLIPQVDVNFNFTVTLRNSLDPSDDYDGFFERSDLFDDGTYLEIRCKEPLIHLKEFNSFYEKENFIIEAFEVAGETSREILKPLKFGGSNKTKVNELAEQLTDGSLPDGPYFFEEEQPTESFVNYFFDLISDESISREILCRAVDSLEVNSQFLDEELICPDQRTDRFNIYDTRVSPQDVEDCD